MSGCWLWKGARNRYGYGVVRWHGAARLAHRVSYELHRGPCPPELDHLCRVPACVNPAHLEGVSHAENVRRGDAPRNTKAAHASITHCPKGHEYTPENTITQRSPAGYTLRACRVCRRAASRDWYARTRSKNRREGNV